MRWEDPTDAYDCQTYMTVILLLTDDEIQIYIIFFYFLVFFFLSPFYFFSIERGQLTVRGKEEDLDHTKLTHYHHHRIIIIQIKISEQINNRIE